MSSSSLSNTYFSYRMGRIKYFLAFFCGISFSTLFADLPTVGFGVGVFNGTNENEAYPLLQAEIKTGWCLGGTLPMKVRPIMGGFVAAKAEGYLYVGACADFNLGKAVVISPSFSPGVYFRGKGIDLGYPLQFRSAIDFAARSPRGDKVGVQIFHLSNANIVQYNPGCECALAYVAFAF